ncbi:MAG: CvpA family protein [Rickettsiales bacterium]
MVDAKLTINVFDLIVITLLFLSALLSMYRGFIREALSLATWIGASLITLYSVKPVAELLLPHVKQPFAATVIAALGTFFFTLLIFSIISSIFARYVKDAGEVGTIDHALGTVFGVVKGSLVIVLVFLLYSQVVSEDDYPEWLKTAASRPYVEKGAKMVVAAMPQYLGQTAKLMDKDSPAPDKLDLENIMPEENKNESPSSDNSNYSDTEKEFQRILKMSPAAGSDHPTN